MSPKKPTIADVVYESILTLGACLGMWWSDARRLWQGTREETKPVAPKPVVVVVDVPGAMLAEAKRIEEAKRDARVNVRAARGWN